METPSAKGRIRNPDQSITRGYDIHLVFSPDQEEEATQLFDKFMEFIQAEKITHDRAKIFSKPVGPWPTPMWQVLLPESPHVESDLGRSISWLMLNHGEFPVMIHPNTKVEEGEGGSVEDHSRNMIWIGEPQKLLIETLEGEK